MIFAISIRACCGTIECTLEKPTITAATHIGKDTCTHIGILVTTKELGMIGKTCNLSIAIGIGRKDCPQREVCCCIPIVS